MLTIHTAFNLLRKQ